METVKTVGEIAKIVGLIAFDVVKTIVVRPSR